MGQMELFDKPEFDLNKPSTFSVPQELAKLFELNVDAFYAALYARMSELPIEAEISRFIEKVGKVKDRATAARLAYDRGDPDVLTVLKAAYKVQHEIHRLTGFLRFSPDAQGVYVARCEPDFFILPALAEHFTLRFGETPWAVIDEKRGICLCGGDGGQARLMVASEYVTSKNEAENSAEAMVFVEDGASVEELWRLYHRSISIEIRKNPDLQRQFIPKRYQKHLNEL